MSRIAVGVLALSAIVVSSQPAFAQVPSGFNAIASGARVAIAWSGGGTDWLVEAGSAPGLADLGAVPFTSPTLRTRSFPNVPPGTYYLRLRAVVGGVPGPASNEAVVTVGCSSDELDLRSTVNGLQVQFDWRQFGGDTTGVVLEAGTGPGLSNIATLALPPFPARFVATGAPGTYYVRVRPVGNCGAGPPSNEVVVNLGSTANCVPTLSPSNRNVTVSGTYTLSITVPSGCAWSVFTRNSRVTPLTLNGVGSGTIQYRVTLPIGGTEQIFVTTSSGRYFANVTS